MNIEQMVVDRAEAERLYRKYKEHRAYSEPIDWEIQRAYQHLSKGRLVIRAIQSVLNSGVNEDGLPKLALCKATAKDCYLHRDQNGSAVMSSVATEYRANKTNSISWRESSFAFPRETFPLTNWGDQPRQRQRRDTRRAQVPLVPIHLRPRRGMPNYHVLFEAEWTPVPPRDPYLLRRIGAADLWLVVAHWDLTEVERAALATRVTVQ
jgi:hypothetical protein